MKTKLSLALILCAALFLSACASSDTAESSTVQQSEIYQDYLIEYNEGLIHVTATFRFGGATGTTLSLTPPSRVMYNGLPLTPGKVMFTGTGYRFMGDLYQPNVAFEFTDTAGKTYTNSIGLNPLEFKTAPAGAAKAAKLLLPVSRIVKEPGVKVELTIRDGAGKEFTSEVKGERGVVGFRNSVYFDESQLSIAVEPDFLKDIPTGPIKISLREEIQQKPAQATHLGGLMTMRYLAKPVSLPLGN